MKFSAHIQAMCEDEKLFKHIRIFFIREGRNCLHCLFTPFTHRSRATQISYSFIQLPKNCDLLLFCKF